MTTLEEQARWAVRGDALIRTAAKLVAAVQSRGVDGTTYTDALVDLVVSAGMPETGARADIAAMIRGAIPKIPTHVVVDTADGYTWAKDRNDAPFTEETALAFARTRNAEMKPGHRSYRMFKLEALPVPRYGWHVLPAHRTNDEDWCGFGGQAVEPSDEWCPNGCVPEGVPGGQS